ncbi:MAG: hypothetical protein E7370_05655 [Clostridiales bacterium]|nr:hypothetical protein [Clostridiales bacterium]
MAKFWGLLLNKLTQFSVTAPVETVVKKLNKAKIPLFHLHKSNSCVLFSTQHKYCKKVFAIFSHPCYNVNVEVYDFKQKAINFAINRIGVFIGALIFLACVFLSNLLVLKIEVKGSGSYLKNEIHGIVSACGVRQFAPFSEDKKPAITAQILSLPQVTYCFVQKRGSVLIIEVATTNSSAPKTQLGGLYSDVNGSLQKIVALCGTACFTEGDKVNKGDLLIGAYSLYDGERVSCMAVGYADILCTASLEYFAEEDSRLNQNNALKAVNLYADNIIEKSLSVVKNSKGVIYKINFSYLRTLSINL